MILRDSVPTHLLTPEHRRVPPVSLASPDPHAPTAHTPHVHTRRHTAHVGRTCGRQRAIVSADVSCVSAGEWGRGGAVVDVGTQGCISRLQRVGLGTYVTKDPSVFHR